MSLRNKLCYKNPVSTKRLCLFTVLLNTTRKVTLLSSIIFMFHCDKKNDTLDTLTDIKTEQKIVESKIPYEKFLKITNNKNASEKKNYFFTFINKDIPDYWVGNPWTFNGTTRTPQSGSIACGYFVTNVLTDYGFKIDRIYFAQQPSSVMIKKLCTSIQYFSDRKKLEDYILTQAKHQIYIVGLDFHTGFISRENKDIYFIHSSYLNNTGVSKELASSSKALNASKTYMLGTLNY